MTNPSTAISRAFGGRAVGWAGGRPDLYLTTPPYSMLELRTIAAYQAFTRRPASTSSTSVPWPGRCALCTGPAGPAGAPGPVGPPGPAGHLAVGDWVWSRNPKYRSIVRGTVVAHSGDYHVYLKLEWPLPYVGKEQGEVPRVWADKLVKPHLLERIAFAASDDAERYRYRRGFRIRLTKREFLAAI